MIPPHKLKKLPPSQIRLKIAKIFREAEHRLLLNGSISSEETACLIEILDMVISSGINSSSGARDSGSEKILKETRKILETAAQDPQNPRVRQSLNSVHYLLLGESGRFPSEWDFDMSNPEGELDPAKRLVFSGTVIYLENIRSPFNVGAMFRTAESFGAEKILLSRFCADPLHPRAKRTAMGCVSVLPWSRLEDDSFDGPDEAPGETIFFALETGGRKLEEFPFPRQGVMIVGSEELGVSPGALARADASLGRVSIPTFGAKGSLNVSVAFGIVMNAWAAFLLKTAPVENRQNNSNML